MAPHAPQVMRYTDIVKRFVHDSRHGVRIVPFGWGLDILTSSLYNTRILAVDSWLMFPTLEKLRVVNLDTSAAQETTPLQVQTSTEDTHVLYVSFNYRIVPFHSPRCHNPINGSARQSR